MFPFSWWWSPVLRLPFSGNVTQDIAPETDWFVGNVNRSVGDPDVERKVVREVASYGKQLSRLTDAVLALAHAQGVEDDAVIQQLGEMAEAIKTAKRQVGEDRRARARRALDELALNDRDALRTLLDEYGNRGG